MCDLLGPLGGQKKQKRKHALVLSVSMFNKSDYVTLN